MRHLLVVHLIVAAILLADRGGFLRGLNDRVEDIRSGLLDRSASGDFVFVAIDADSIRAVGTWPWSRQVHADILENLSRAGAIDVFFDIDFAFPADPAGDAAFAAALDRSGSAYLPVFQQLSRTNSSEEIINWPMEDFAQRSWPALVNVFGDTQGAIRFYPYGAVIAEEYIPSAAALITGTFSERSGSFPINYAIRPDSVPVLSAVDVAEGRFEADMIAGRSIVVGASAIELGDLFAVPVHGIIPGPLVHVLAAETLAGGIVPATLATGWILLGLLVLLLLFQMRAFRKPTALITAAGLALVASEVAAFGVFAQHAIVVPTAPLYPGLLVFCSWSLLWRLKINRTIIARQRQEVANTSALLRQVFEDSFDAIAILDETGRVRMHSDSAARLFDYSDTQDLMLPARLKTEAMTAMRAGGDGAMRTYESLGNGTALHLEYTVTPSETVTFDQNKEQTVQIATLSMRDVTKIKQQERDIAYLSSYDALTGALRRSVFLDFIKLRAEAGECFAIFVFNLSRFKTVNVVLGRDVGDALLRHVVKRLEEAELNISAAARLGGDTFACFTEFAVDDTDAQDLAHRLCEIIGKPYELEDSNARVGLKLGYSIIDPGTDVSASDALSQAEEALDAAKLAGNDAPHPYNPAMSKKQFRSRAIERAMGRALDREEFEVWYQPQHRVDDLKLIGSEALLRWKSDTLGQVYPDEFIEIAESTGFINELGAWVLDKAVRDTMRLPPHMSVAVNVSGVQMTSENIVSDINRLLQETQFPATRLCLELTETVLFDGTGELVEMMRDIQFRGVCWALDDFGTGYSSLGYLSQLPIEKLKVDKSFMLGLGTDPAAEPILTAVGDLCRGLGMTLLCEGVETDEHLKFLQTREVAEAQGYLFGKPMPFSDFQAYATDCATSNRRGKANS
ncbi:EAL domain-containing protein [uncultured Roseobacter sp.]|uniref:EAL domain-containing protein n=1 Tax=uncultured Roseobacter sp. TaxID=114847 RepID=UPI0026128960|nr:EAL domain-containing protein [uncultured Roseobacter sp.]